MSQASQPSAAGREFDAGEVLFREGDSGALLFIIQEGEVRVSKRIDGEPTTIADLGPGDFVGEIGVVRNQAHTTTAVATRPTRCLAIDGRTLEQMVAGDGEIAVRFIRGMADRLAASQSPASPPLYSSQRRRGMRWWTDLVDWIGGWPFEVAKPEEVFVFLRDRGFELVELKTCGGGLGCNEFLFRRRA